MDDNNIRELFNDFNPLISDSDRFISRLQHQLDIVDIVKARSQTIHKATRRAAIIAGTTGFIAGFLLSMLLPHIATFVSRLNLNAYSLGLSVDVENIYATISWLLIGIISTFIAVNAYSLSLSLLNHSKQQ